MSKAAITQYFDVAQLVLYMFWIFFAGLIWYLVRENRREGYPLDNDRGMVMEGWIPVPPPKVYKLADGREISAPDNKVSPQTLNAEPLQRHGGTAYEPTGNPLLAGVGPGSWNDRADVPDLDHDGNPKIRPLSVLGEGYGVNPRDPDPRGQQVIDARGAVAGTVVDLWMDVAESMFRYLEVELAAGGRRVLCPITFSRINSRGEVRVHALLASQFADVPATRANDRITLLEEERVTAYYGGGLLYAEPARAEPLI
jgi:photosynthetic reaction center H subunit